MASLSNFHQELLTHWSSDIWVKWSFLLLGVPYAGTFGCGCGLRMMVTLCLLALWDELGFFASPEVILFMFSHQETCHKKPSIILGDVCLLGVHLPFGTGWKKHISLVNAIAEGIKCLSALPETALYDFASSDMRLQGSRSSSAVRHREQVVPSWLLSDLILP